MTKCELHPLNPQGLLFGDDRGDYVNSTRTGSQTFRFKDSELLIFPGGKIAGLRAGIIAGFAYSWPAVEQPS